MGHAADDVAKPGLGVDVVWATGLDEGVRDSGAAAAFIRAGEQVILARANERAMARRTGTRPGGRLLLFFRTDGKAGSPFHGAGIALAIRAKRKWGQAIENTQLRKWSISHPQRSQ
jgi:hypothetical protein